jgi:quinol monooxygenase YgiN
VIIVTGSVRAKPDTIDQVLAIGLEHVHRSRLEPGCRLHSVHRDVEDPLHVVFLEQWSDIDALHAHFRVPESRELAKSLNALAATPPEMNIYNVEETS